MSDNQTGSRICGRYSAMRDGKLFTSVVSAFTTQTQSAEYDSHITKTTNDTATEHSHLQLKNADAKKGNWYDVKWLKEVNS